MTEDLKHLPEDITYSENVPINLPAYGIVKQQLSQERIASSRNAAAPLGLEHHLHSMGRITSDLKFVESAQCCFGFCLAAGLYSMQLDLGRAADRSAGGAHLAVAWLLPAALGAAEALLALGVAEWAAALQ